MSMLGMYQPGSSVVHGMPAGGKLALMVLAGVGSIFLAQAWQVGLAMVGVLGLFLLAGISLLTAVKQIRPLLWIVAFVALFHVILSGWERAFVVVGVIAGLVLLASLVTLTTRTTDMVDAVVRILRPLRLVGVDPDRVGLVLALGIRSVPVVVALAEQVRDAQRARGLTASPRAFAVPLIVRSLRHADALGEALVARGVDD
ncbi:MAG TPA: energy-coupling factor transporter transmembrane protein EcfT [Nocardioidaceae bacterium]|nr:energy-coupling factor transporter transmembrane protein EcfT [Nocardioidaceae bacterium]